MAVTACATASLLAAFPAFAACSLKTQPIKVTMVGGAQPMVDTRPMVDVKVNGKAGRFLLDSASAVDQINNKYAAAQKLTPTKASTGAAIVTAPSFEFAGSTFKNAPFAAADVAGADGVIGQSLLRLMDVEYDLAGGSVKLAKADGCETSNMAYWAKEGDLYWEMPLVQAANGVPLTEAEIVVNGVKMTALFDTGIPFSAITEQAAAKAGVKTTDPAVKPVRGAQGEWIGNFTVNVGGEEAKDAPLEIAQSKDSYYDVLIGADYFLTHHVYVANSQHKIYATRAGFPGAPMFTAHQPQAAGMDTSAASRGRLDDQ